ncbi:uncharacterized protein LOC123466248 [Daphnia magna]|uniref:uncharacterized protein LOC123466248 n=1 Tax=Daphnia magna TaxID=35525 RepID=UPI001402E53C|nr:uncharacterized protein LOC123466248 [Daphnia magna]
MKAILENQSVTDEVLRTVFAEVASLLNSRPLTNVLTDPAEPEPLTPFHFILGCANPHQAPDSESAFDGLSRRKWKQAQFITDQFWKRWMREYLPSLIERKKWDKSVRPLRVGDNVLIMDENTRRGEWLTGQITKVFPSSDNVIRSSPAGLIPPASRTVAHQRQRKREAAPWQRSRRKRHLPATFLKV